MTHILHRLTADGIARFSDFLADLRTNGSLPVPEYLLTDPSSSSKLDHVIEIERPGFKTKREAAEYLKARLAPLPSTSSVMSDAGLWSWLGLFYFDDLCPPNDNGKRKPNRDPHYILEALNSQRRYRHLLATPFQIVTAMPDHNRIYLDAPLSIHGDLVEQTMSRLFLIRLPAVRALIDKLYYDECEGKAKRGILPKKERRGDLRNRLPIRLRQLLATYDVAGITSDQLLELLGDEFTGWLT